AYARTQGWDADFTQTLIDLVFAAESPRGSHVSKIGLDPLTNEPRAPKATDSFQSFRIASVLANIRITDGEQSRRLTQFERSQAFEFILDTKPGEQPTWAEIAKKLGYKRSQLAGTAAVDEEGGERLPLRPPVHVS